MADTVRRGKPLLLPAAVVASVLLCAIIGWMIESRASILRDGEEIVLRSGPIDPRDLLRGHFVRLNYAAERLSDDVLDGLREDAGEDQLYDVTVFVRFDVGEDDLHWPISTSLSRPEEGPFLRGRVNRFEAGMRTVLIDYGIDRFYADEYRAPELERNMREGMVTEIVVAAGRDGTAQIKALRQGGEIIMTEQLY